MKSHSCIICDNNMKLMIFLKEGLKGLVIRRYLLYNLILGSEKAEMLRAYKVKVVLMADRWLSMAKGEIQLKLRNSR